MNHVRQCHNECMLATFAMLFDINYSDVRHLARKVTGYYEYADWMEAAHRKPVGDGGVHPSSPVFLKLGYELMRHTGNSSIVPWMCQLINKVIEPKLRNVPMFSKQLRNVPMFSEQGVKSLDLSGTGGILILFLDLSSHIIAYGNNKIYDPSNEFPCSWEAYFHLRETYISEIYQVPLKLAPSSLATSNEVPR